MGYRRRKAPYFRQIPVCRLIRMTPVKQKKRNKLARLMYSSLTDQTWRREPSAAMPCLSRLQDYLADPDSMMDILEALEEAADAAY